MLYNMLLSSSFLNEKFQCGMFLKVTGENVKRSVAELATLDQCHYLGFDNVYIYIEGHWDKEAHRGFPGTYRLSCSLP